ncbi:MAG: RsmE family RNA methyltransferase [Kofleriaceae bacterium]
MIRLRVAPAVLGAAPTLVVGGAEHAYLSRVRRAAVGDQVEVFDGAGRAAPATIAAIEANRAVLALGEVVAEAAPGPHLTALVPLIKGDRLEQCLEKLVEVGVGEIVTYVAARAVVRLDGPRARERARRWQAIVDAAARQAGRARAPSVSPPVALEVALAGLPVDAARWVGTPTASAPPRWPPGAVAGAVLTGPRAASTTPSWRSRRRPGSCRCGWAPTSCAPRPPRWSRSRRCACPGDPESRDCAGRRRGRITPGGMRDDDARGAGTSEGSGPTVAAAADGADTERTPAVDDEPPVVAEAPPRDVVADALPRAKADSMSAIPKSPRATRPWQKPAPTVYVVGFWRRLGAGLIDLAVIAPAALAVVWLASRLTGVHLPRGLDFWLDLILASDPALVMATGLTIAVAAVYALVFQVLQARTLGMRVLKMRVIDVHGDPPSPARCLARTLGYVGGVATLFLGFLWIGFDREKRGLQDWIAGTYVIRG